MMDEAAPGSDLPAEDLPEAITRSLLRVINRIQAGRRLLRDGTGEMLTLIEAETCSLINQRKGISATQLSEILAVSRSAVSQVTTRLKKKGYIREESDATHAKRRLLYLTPLGEKAFEVASKLEEAMTQMLFDEDAEELRTYYRFVTKLEHFHSSIRLVRPQSEV